MDNLTSTGIKEKRTRIGIYNVYNDVRRWHVCVCCIDIVNSKRELHVLVYVGGRTAGWSVAGIALQQKGETSTR